jgi:hypothetical protein
MSAHMNMSIDRERKMAHAHGERERKPLAHERELYTPNIDTLINHCAFLSVDLNTDEKSI